MAKVKSVAKKAKRITGKNRTASASRSKAAGRNGTTKTAAAVKLAERKLGINGNELMAATSWPSGSAKYRVRAWAKARDMGWEPVKRKDGSKAYRLVPKPAGKAKPASKTKATKVVAAAATATP